MPLRPVHSPEIIIGLIGAIGADLGAVCEMLSQVLREFKYEPVVIHLIEEIHAFPQWGSLAEEPVDARYDSHMTAGNEFRKKLNFGGALALLGIHRIAKTRPAGQSTPALRKAYILRSLKHPEEIYTLREVYGDGFVSISCFSPVTERKAKLAQQIAQSRKKLRAEEEHLTSAQHLIERDEKEHVDFGQNIEETFPLADCFVSIKDGTKLHSSLRRFVQLYFGHPFVTPNRDEQGMAFAHTAAVRSSALGRQVGACLTNEKGELIAIGCNEVPRAGGGLYWEGDPGDARDFKLKYDTSDEMKRENVRELLERLRAADLLKDENTDLSTLSEDVLPHIRRTRMMNPIEYGRCEHAEQSALFDAARRGAAVKDSVLYTTTFPCHECARHIVTAGVKRVVYIEPYPKSLASRFHSDAIEVDPSTRTQGKVVFEAFVGVSPRQYTRLFYAARRKQPNGVIVDWRPAESNPRIRNSDMSYLELEDLALKKLRGQIAQVDLEL